MSRSNPLRQVFLAFCLALLGMVAPAALAAQSTVYVIVPTLGPGELVRAAIVTGSHLDRSARTPLPGLGATFDDDIVAIVEQAILTADPRAAAVHRVRLSDGALFQDNTEEDDRAGIEALRGALDGLIKTSRVLAVVIAPWRADVRLRISNGFYGSGKAKGLGFYVDYTRGLRVADAAQGDPGYLGIFANLRLLLVDLNQASISSVQTAAEGTTHAIATSNGATAWDAIPNDQKLAILRAITLREIQRMTPLLLAPR